MNIQAKISEILRCEAQAIANVKVTPAFEEAVLALERCKGKVVTTGIGKAGHVAQKFSGTLCSGAKPAVFLHPTEAVHGDLGVIQADDCIVAFSNSGKSNEVIEMLELSRHLGVSTVIGITSHPDSPLRQLSSIVLDMGQIEEPCPFKMTPSASIVVMLAIGDALALTLLELRGVTRQQFGLRHHGGYLGRKARTDNL